MNWYDANGFKKLTEEEANKLNLEQLGEYQAAKFTDQTEKTQKQLDTIKKENELYAEKLEEVNTVMEGMNKTINALKEKGVEKGSKTFESELKKAFDKNLDKIKAMSSGSLVNLEITKGTQDYGDIDSGLDFAQMRAGVTDIPVRQPLFRSLFSTIPLSTEFYKYVEQETVVRDAKNVAKCEAVSTNTKETLKVNNITTTKIKDMIMFCIDFVDDYGFMESRIRQLLLSSVSLRVDQQILLGSGTGDETFSIDSVASEFDATNTAANVEDSVQDASFVDLIIAMQVQIDVLGQEGSYTADTVILNRVDWFKGVESRKDANNNYLDDRVTYVNGVPFIRGMRVLTSPLVPANTVYVFDSSKGEIIQRKGINVSLSFENQDAWEKEIGYIKAYECLNFLVINNNKNAFMKSSDVDAAIEAINITP